MMTSTLHRGVRVRIAGIAKPCVRGMSSVSSFSSWGRNGSNPLGLGHPTSPPVKMFERQMSIAELRRPGSMAMFGPSFAYEHMQHIERMATQQELERIAQAQAQAALQAQQLQKMDFDRRARNNPLFPPPLGPEEEPSPYRFARNRAARTAASTTSPLEQTSISTPTSASTSITTTSPQQATSSEPVSSPSVDHDSSSSPSPSSCPTSDASSTPSRSSSPSPDMPSSSESLHLISTRRQRYRKMKRHKYRKRLRKLRHVNRKPFAI